MFRTSLRVGTMTLMWLKGVCCAPPHIRVRDTTPTPRMIPRRWYESLQRSEHHVMPHGSSLPLVEKISYSIAQNAQ